MTRRERDLAIVQAFEKCISEGATKTEATRKVRRIFRFLTDVPVYNARRRVAGYNGGKEVENG